MNFDKLRGYGELALKGLLANNAPALAKGMLVELIRQNNITVDKVIDSVNKDQRLWDMIDPKHYERIQNTIARVGDNMDWFTTEWLIVAIKADHTALASLFLSWRKARNWLDRQIEDMRKEVFTDEQ